MFLRPTAFIGFAIGILMLVFAVSALKDGHVGVVIVFSILAVLNFTSALTNLSVYYKRYR